MKTSGYIPTSRIDEIKHLVDKLNRRIKKRDGNGSTFSITIGSEVGIYDPRSSRNDIIQFPATYVTLSGEMPVFDRYQMIAALDHVKGGNIVRSFNDVPEEFLHSESTRCDHCKHKRQRVTSYVMFDTEDQKFMQIGKSCMKDFMADAEDAESVFNAHKNLKSISNIWSDFDSMEDGYYGGGSASMRFFDTREFMHYIVSQYLEDGGFLTVGESNEMYFDERAATVVRAINNMKHLSVSKGPHQVDKDECHELVNDVFEWLGGIEPTSNYMSNIKTLRTSTFIDSKHLKIFGSSFGVYLKDKARKQAAGLFAGSSHIGEEKERREFDIKVVSIIKKIDQFSGEESQAITMESDGNCLKWFTGSNRHLEEGREYKVKATVKRHNEYQGIKETVVNRVSLIK